MANIFISYRREDSGGHAGRLCDRLDARFGNARVFMDLQDIAPGQNFAQSIDDTVAACDCVIAVIGPRWLETVQQRAGNAEDFVRHEIAAALRRNVTVIPVLVGGARMPAPEQLPAALAALSYRNAFEVRDERFDNDVSLLSEAIHALGIAEDGAASKAAPPKGTGRTSWAIPVLVVVLVVAAAGAYLAWRSAGPASVEGAAAAVVPAFDLNGDWLADMQKEGQRPFRIRLTFVTVGNSISGIVRYPTGDGPILDAHRVGNVLTFHTEHVPQFASTPATIRYQAELVGDEIRFTTTDDSGLGTGIARRRPAAGRRGAGRQGVAGAGALKN